MDIFTIAIIIIIMIMVIIMDFMMGTGGAMKMDMTMLIWVKLQERYEIFARNNKLFNKFESLGLI